jgi:hypothetical protein
MRKQIRGQLYKIFGAIGLILGLVTWQFDFVWTGINSNIYLNMTIVGMFFFGLALAFKSVFSLGNEVTAFDCLKEAYDDVRLIEAKSIKEPFWRHYRCLEPAKTFNKPKLLGHVFALTYEKVMRTHDLKINIGTMQSLVSELNSKLADDRSMLNYVTGLLVFLGLIGTFIGLMNMVGSVGDIIGGLADMDSGSNEAFMKLINDLKAPLVGMATGFSSSLFGLFGSLVLGLIARFVNQATGILKTEFESWLAQAAEIDAEDEEGEVADLRHLLPKMSEEFSKAGNRIAAAAASSNRNMEYLAWRMEELLQDKKQHVEDKDRRPVTPHREKLVQKKRNRKFRRRLHPAQPMTEGQLAVKELETISKGMEDALRDGLTEVARSVETAFQCYAAVITKDDAVRLESMKQVLPTKTTQKRVL